MPYTSNIQFLVYFFFVFLSFFANIIIIFYSFSILLLPLKSSYGCCCWCWCCSVILHSFSLHHIVVVSSFSFFLYAVQVYLLTYNRNDRLSIRVVCCTQTNETYVSRFYFQILLLRIFNSCLGLSLHPISLFLFLFSSHFVRHDLNT